jgi:5-amino-6-(5-phospho-D-ribitylamino)uracil phosphatase
VWKPKLVALDLDGTLVTTDNAIPEDVADAVRAAARAGAHVVIATGRGWHAVRPHVDALGLPAGPHVVSNGAVVVRYPPLHIDDLITFDQAPVIARVLQEHPRALLAVEKVGVGYLVSDHFPVGELGGNVEVVSIEELGAHPGPRLVVRDPNASDGEFIRLAERMGMSGVSYSIGYTAWLDIAPEGVNKATGLASVAERLHIHPADVLAIGDGRNDIEMLTWAGRGVTFADSPPEVRAVADAVAVPFAHGGTTAELRLWF